MLRSIYSRERLRLPQTTTNLITADLLAYLFAYSGFEKLTLLSPDGGSPDASNRLADALFGMVLPRHAESLTELSCPAAYESRFSFGLHNVQVVSSRHKLTDLR
ncbi:hypothetical protein C8R45DRAFT_843978 [Mycena sanguinolenta]|nr:hypothetical protein C8R45DRAFT_843978 [Mycena sanguinolenta]